MSTATIPNLETASEDWQLADEGRNPVSLIVQLRRHIHVLPYFRLVYAEGDCSQVQIAFASHPAARLTMVTVTGHGLAALLAAVAGHRVVRLIHPTESEARFGVRGTAANRYDGPGITAITVEQFEVR